MVIIDFAEFIIVILTTHYTYHILSMIFNKNARVEVQKTNTYLDNLRKKPIKSIEEQKEFINSKYPKIIGTNNWQWKNFPKVLLTIIIYIFIFKTYMNLIIYIDYDFNIWHGILYIIFFPIIINFLLEKFKIHKGDLSVYIKK